MNCPECHKLFENCLQCPDCGAPLGYRKEPGQGEGELSAFAGSDAHRWQPLPLANRSAATSGHWFHSNFGRLVSSLLLALGLSCISLPLYVAVLDLWATRAHREISNSSFGLALFYGMQALSLLTAGAVLGAGRQSEISFGAAIGLISGTAIAGGIQSGLFSSLLPGFMPHTLSTQLLPHLLYGLPIAHVSCGALGTRIGRLCKAADNP